MQKQADPWQVFRRWFHEKYAANASRNYRYAFAEIVSMDEQIEVS